MTVADPDGQNNAREVEEVPDPYFGDYNHPGEAEYYYWEYEAPAIDEIRMMEYEDQVDEEYDYPAEEDQINEESNVQVNLYDVRVMVEELDEYEEEDDEEEERDTPRAALLAAWWEYKRQNRHKRKTRKLTLYRVDNSDRYADGEEFNYNEPC